MAEYVITITTDRSDYVEAFRVIASGMGCRVDVSQKYPLSGGTWEFSKTAAQIADELNIKDNQYTTREGFISRFDDAAKKGKFIWCIKEFRAATGMGLKETKDYLDLLRIWKA